MSRRDKFTDQAMPRLPRVGVSDITPQYIDQLVIALEDALYMLNSTRHRTFSEITLANTQEHGGNLRTGDVFSDEGFLKIVRAGDTYVSGLAGTTGIGTVTVTTT